MERNLKGAARTYLETLIDHFKDVEKTDPALGPFIRQLATVDSSSMQRGPDPRLDHPAMTFLDQALNAACGDPVLVQSAVDAGRKLDWHQLYGGGGMEPALAEGMLAAQVAGSYGCFASTEVATGQFLLAPNIRYPLHTHLAKEIYYCLSGTLYLQHGVDGTPFEVQTGSYSITPSNQLHALWTGDEPVLLLYVWIDEIVCPIWCWDQDEDGAWFRSSWRRVPGEPWKIVATEPVTDAVMAEAHR